VNGPELESEVVQLPQLVSLQELNRALALVLQYTEGIALVMPQVWHFEVLDEHHVESGRHGFDEVGQKVATAESGVWLRILDRGLGIGSVGMQVAEDVLRSQRNLRVSPTSSDVGRREECIGCKNGIVR
jgi:hypothetical protein